jgi:hypothetical protein
VVYLNGQEIFRENLPPGEILPTTIARADVGSTEEQTLFRRLIAPAGLVNGTNLLAVELHQFRTNSTDLGFALELVALTTLPDAFVPTLTADRSGAELRVTWPTPFPGWSLYSAQSLEPALDWLRVGVPPTESNSLNRVTLAPTNASRFFQLRRPDYCSPFQ